MSDIVVPPLALKYNNGEAVLITIFPPIANLALREDKYESGAALIPKAVTLAYPSTSSFSVGLVVPIPKSPTELNLAYSESVVPLFPWKEILPKFVPFLACNFNAPPWVNTSLSQLVPSVSTIFILGSEASICKLSLGLVVPIPTLPPLK